MNVNTIEIPKEEALSKLAQYRGRNRKRMLPEDKRLAQLYRMVANGGRVIDINEAFKVAGLNDKDYPKLGIARGDWRNVFYRHGGNGSGRFRGVNDFWKNNLITIPLPIVTFDHVARMTDETVVASVPHIPIEIRPEIHLSNFHILFEVAEWTPAKQLPRYSRDPFLLRHIAGSLYVVVAEWELTPLEASLLGSMRNGN